MPMSRFQRIEARLEEYDRLLDIEALRAGYVDSAADAGEDPAGEPVAEGPVSESGEPPAQPETDAQPAKPKRGKGD